MPDWIAEQNKAIRKKQEHQYFEERLRDKIVAGVYRDADNIVKRLAPDGRPPFTVPLSKAELTERLRNAQEADWYQWATRLAGIPDPKERQKAMGDLFKQWADQQLGKWDAQFGPTGGNDGTDDSQPVAGL
jgi:hypothetical protein